MAVMTGSLTDAGEQSIAGLRPRMLWTLNRTTLHGSTVVVNHPVEATISGANFTVNLEPTEIGEYYTVRVEYFSPDGQLVLWRDLDRRIQVDESGGDIGGGAGVVITPNLVYVGLEPPTDERWQFWLEAAIGDPDPGTSTGPGILHRRTA